MKARSKILPPFMGPDRVYMGKHRRSLSCENCPLRQEVPFGAHVEHKCRITGEYEVPSRTSVCPLPCAPRMVEVSEEVERPVCFQGSAVIDLRSIHWSYRQEVAQRDLENGCIPAQALKGGEIVALEGFRVTCKPFGGRGSRWGRFIIEWEALASVGGENGN